jgi:ribosomal protein S18 acetylase RimI-like enzyme
LIKILQMQPEISTYNPKYKTDFINLNKAWLEEYFFVEQHDIDVFNTVEESIIATGGEIFFYLINDEVAGTVAMQKINDTTFEMAKLAVNKKFQGKDIGKKLIETCIEFAKQKEAKTIMLMSSTKLDVALHLYKKYNFVEVPLAENDYARADIQMELNLE